MGSLPGMIEKHDNILYENLQMKKMCAWWVPRLLTIDQQHTRFARFLAAIRDSAGDLDPPVHIWVQTAVGAVN